MLQPTKVNKFFFEGYMKIQLKLMVLTLALFSFANASDEVTDDVDALLGATEPKKMAVKLDSKQDMAVDDSEVERLLQSCKKDAPRDSDELVKIQNGFATLGRDLHKLGFLGAARELKCAVDYVLSPENFEKAANLYTAGKNKAWSFLDSVRRNVPGAALATTGVLVLDSVSTEIVCESSIYALMLGGGLCYVASRCESQRPARKLKSDESSEVKRLLAAIVAQESKQKDNDSEEDGSDDHVAEVAKPTASLVEALTGKKKEKEEVKSTDASDASDASAGGGALQKELKNHESTHPTQQGGAVAKDMEAQPKGFC